MLSTRAIYLRAGCLLPSGLKLRRAPFGKSWTTVEDAAPIELAHAVREAGWHFMWIDSDCSRTGWGLNDEAAITRAITRALTRMRRGFNGAEVGVIRVSRHMGLCIAKVTVHSRHIQQSASLDSPDGLPIRQLI